MESFSQDTVIAETQFVVNWEIQSAEGKKARGRGIESSVKTHPMKTRISKQSSYPGNEKVTWNLEVEIAKVIEKGVEIGIDSKAKNQRGSEGVGF